MSASRPDFTTHLPHPSLRPYVAQYTGFRADDLVPGAHDGLPNRHILLALSLDAPIDILRMPGAAQAPTALTTLVSGLQIAPTTVRYGTRRDGIFVHMTPAGAHALLGVTSRELSARIVDLSVLWSDAGSLVERLRNISSWRDRFALLDAVFLQRLRPVTPAKELTWAWHELARTHGNTPVKKIAKNLGWSRQYFRARFHAELGVPPKTAARIFRFERAMRVLQSRRLNLVQAAAECGYYDQSHMTAEWNELAGCTPRRWLAAEFPFFQDQDLVQEDSWR